MDRSTHSARRNRSADDDVAAWIASTSADGVIQFDGLQMIHSNLYFHFAINMYGITHSNTARSGQTLTGQCVNLRTNEMRYRSLDQRHYRDLLGGSRSEIDASN